MSLIKKSQKHQRHSRKKFYDIKMKTENSENVKTEPPSGKFSKIEKKIGKIKVSFLNKKSKSKLFEKKIINFQTKKIINFQTKKIINFQRKKNQLLS